MSGRIMILGGFVQPPSLYQPLADLLAKWGQVEIVPFSRLLSLDWLNDSLDIVVGHSMGAMRALELMALGKLPGAKLILFSGSVRSHWSQSELKQLEHKFLSDDEVGTFDFYKGCAYPQRLDDGELRACRANGVSGGREAIKGALEYLGQVDLRPVLAELSQPAAPILSLAGGRDRIIPLPSSRELSQLLKIEELVTPRAGHWLVQQNLAELEPVIQRFLTGQG